MEKGINWKNIDIKKLILLLNFNVLKFSHFLTCIKCSLKIP